MVGREAQDISILESLEKTHATWVPCRCHKGDTWLQQTVSFLSVHLKVSICLLIFLSGSFRVTSSLKFDSVNSIRLRWDLPLLVSFQMEMILIGC